MKNLLNMVARNYGLENELTISIFRAAENGATLETLQNMITNYHEEDEDEEP